MFSSPCLSEYGGITNSKFSNDRFLAQCSEKYERIQKKSNELWRCQRFWLFYEFKDKTVLPPPLNIPCYLFRLIKTLYDNCKKRRKPPRDNQNASKIILTVRCPR